MTYKQLARVTDEELAAMSAEELARFGYELRVAELERASARNYWKLGAILWATCIIGLTIHSLI